MSKNILFYSHQANLAGAPLSLAALASNLPKKYKTIFVAPQQGEVLKKVKGRKKVIGPWLQTIKLIKIIREENIDLIHANTLLATPAVYAAKITGMKLIWHIREDLSIYPNKIINKILNYADKAIIISDSMRKYFGKTKKVIRIYNGLPQPKVIKYSKIKQNNLLFAGTLEPRKGVKELIMAVEILKNKQLADFKLNIYGEPLSVTKNYYKRLVNYVHKHKLKDLVCFKGITSNIQKEISRSNIIVIPSLAEPFGRVAVEAMSLRKPVVATKVGGLAEIIKDKQTGLLSKPKDIKSLADNLEKLLKNIKLQNKMGQAGYLRYKKYFTLAEHVKNIEKVYKELIG